MARTVTTNPASARQFRRYWTVIGPFAGYILFVFVIIMTTFAAPREHRQRVLIFGIIAALVLRAVFIAVGAALLSPVHPLGVPHSPGGIALPAYRRAPVVLL